MEPATAPIALTLTAVALLMVAVVHEEPQLYAVGSVWLAGAAIAVSPYRRIAVSTALLLGVIGLAAGSPAYRYGLSHFNSVADFGPAAVALTGSTLTVMASISEIGRRMAVHAGRMARLVPTVGVGSAVVVAVLVSLSFVLTLTGRTSVSDAETAGAVAVRMKDITFDPAVVSLDRAGPMRVLVRNDDLISHTFAVAADGTNVSVGPGSEKLIGLTLERGRYDFRCTVPGHDAMRGSVLVE